MKHQILYCDDNAIFNLIMKKALDSEPRVWAMNSMNSANSSSSCKHKHYYFPAMPALVCGAQSQPGDFCGESWLFSLQRIRIGNLEAPRKFRPQISIHYWCHEANAPLADLLRKLDRK